MPITLLDIALLVVMLISGLLAMVRGFMREILSIVSWVAAAFGAFYAYQHFLPLAQQYFSNEYVAKGVVLGGGFLLTLIIVSIITIKISDMVLDSKVGALDRTLGFLFGLARGLIIVVVAYLFFDWLVPQKVQPSWVANAKSQVVLKSTGDWLKSMLPDDPESTILKRFKRQKPDEQPETPETTPERKSEIDRTTTGTIKTNADTEPGYDRAERDEMRKLLQATTPKR